MNKKDYRALQVLSKLYIDDHIKLLRDRMSYEKIIRSEHTGRKRLVIQYIHLKAKRAYMGVLSVIIFMVALSCDSKPKSTYADRKPIPYKPFYVYNKIAQEHTTVSMYDCVDKNGTRFWFYDLTEKYSVGDSIK